uniref:Uncharacterized protein LOC104224602 n=1 Tax=Nicotiana sylvestris TaxID=4096 RepID=A0A1U7W3G6_NICSY|nr:PREDICTED: uncharacterized protein LOC104224602 [Nicotiana sylvestris]
MQRELGTRIELNTILHPQTDGQFEFTLQILEALYERRCRSPIDWFEPGEARLLGTDLVYDALENVKVIQEGLCTTQSMQKSYADRKVLDVAYIVGEKVLLRVSPMKGVIRFGKKIKLSPQHIVTFKLLERVGEVAYRLAFPPSLSRVHPVFHVFILWKCCGDPSHILDFSMVQLDGDLTYNVEPVTILDRQV